MARAWLDSIDFRQHCSTAMVRLEYSVDVHPIAVRLDWQVAASQHSLARRAVGSGQQNPELYLELNLEVQVHLRVALGHRVGCPVAMPAGNQVARHWAVVQPEAISQVCLGPAARAVLALVVQHSAAVEIRQPVADTRLVEPMHHCASIDGSWTLMDHGHEVDCWMNLGCYGLVRMQSVRYRWLRIRAVALAQNHLRLQQSIEPKSPMVRTTVSDRCWLDRARPPQR